jgi:hypothetical protein
LITLRVSTANLCVIVLRGQLGLIGNETQVA